jgi:hypothetical protein
MNTLVKKSNTSGGFIRTILLIIIALLVISYFGLNIRTIVNSPAGKDNFTYTQEIMISVWNNYLKGPANYLWNDIFLDLIWVPAVENLQKIKDGEQDDIVKSAPRLPDSRSRPDSGKACTPGGICRNE